MSEERQLIMQMLADGKITAEQADRLLEACNEGRTRTTSLDESDGIFASAEGMSADGLQQDGLQQEAQEIAANAGSLLTEFLRKLDFSKIWSSPLLSHLSTYGGIKVTKQIEGVFTNCLPISVDIAGKHGDIHVYPTSDNNYRGELVIYVDAEDDSQAHKLIEEKLKINSDDKSLLIKPIDEDIIRSLALDLYLPKEKIYDLKLKSTHGKITAEDLQVTLLEVKTTHGAVRVDDINAEHSNVLVHTTHGSITLNRMLAANITAVSSHAAINIDEMKAGDVRLKSSHGLIDVEGSAQSLVAHTTHAPIEAGLYNWQGGEVNLCTTHSSIQIDSRISPEVGISFEANAPHGKVRIENERFDPVVAKGQLSAQTRGFDNAKQKLTITAKTRHGAISFK